MLTKDQFKILRTLNVSTMLEKKGGFDYLSWSHALGLLLENDPEATWEFLEPKMFGPTMMTFCKVTAFGKTHSMHLPVMDYKNNAQPDPDARDVSDTMMRCLVKCIATFGIGLNVYSGDALPDESKQQRKNHAETTRNANAPKLTLKASGTSNTAKTGSFDGHGGLQEDDVPNFASESIPDFIPPKQNGEFVINFGNKYKRQKNPRHPFLELDGYANYLTEWAEQNGKPLSKEVKDFLTALYGN